MDFILMFSICMITNANVCKDLSVNVYQTNQMQCLREAEQEMMKMMGNYPGWKITRWKCEDAERYNKKKGKSI